MQLRRQVRAFSRRHQGQAQNYDQVQKGNDGLHGACEGLSFEGCFLLIPHSMISPYTWIYIYIYIYIGGPGACDTHSHFASSHHGWEISHEWGSPSWNTSWKGIPHEGIPFVVKYRPQVADVTEAKLKEHVEAMKNNFQVMDYTLENFDEFHNKYTAMMKGWKHEHWHEGNCRVCVLTDGV